MFHKKPELFSEKPKNFPENPVNKEKNDFSNLFPKNPELFHKNPELFPENPVNKEKNDFSNFVPEKPKNFPKKPEIESNMMPDLKLIEKNDFNYNVNDINDGVIGLEKIKEFLVKARKIVEEIKLRNDKTKIEYEKNNNESEQIRNAFTGDDIYSHRKLLIFDNYNSKTTYIIAMTKILNEMQYVIDQISRCNDALGSSDDVNNLIFNEDILFEIEKKIKDLKVMVADLKELFKNDEGVN